MTDVLRILIAPLVWLAAFSAVYGLQGLICGHGIEGTVLGIISLQRALMASAYTLSMAMLAVLLWGLTAQRFASASPFVRFVSQTAGWVFLVATAWSLFPAVATTHCV
jgi:hypothetical protein